MVIQLYMGLVHKNSGNIEIQYLYTYLRLMRILVVFRSMGIYMHLLLYCDLLLTWKKYPSFWTFHFKRPDRSNRVSSPCVSPSMNKCLYGCHCIPCFKVMMPWKFMRRMMMMMMMRRRRIVHINVYIYILDLALFRKLAECPHFVQCIQKFVRLERRLNECENGFHLRLANGA